MRLATIFPILQFSSYSTRPWYQDLWYKLGLEGGYPHRSFVSFDLVSPRVESLNWDDRCDHNYVLLTPRGSSVPSPGPLMLDAKGELIWAEDKFGQVMNLMIQKYRGDDYITFWSGTDDKTHGRGYYYMLDSAYNIVNKISAAGGLQGDLHEFKITDNDTALITVYEVIQADFSSLGRGSDQGWIYDGLFQEIDIMTGDLLFQWRASDFYKVEESLLPLEGLGKTKDAAYDYFHINSVDKDVAGNYYVSSRYMHTVTCISPAGEILWVLGGLQNEFADLSDGAATNFSWQHHAVWHPDGKLTIFDNGASRRGITAESSRGLTVALDTDNMTASLTHAYFSPDRFLSESQGSVQILPENGNVFVGWGHSPAYTEFTNDGTTLCHFIFGSPAFFGWGWVKSYRVFKSPWVGRPNSPPDIAMKDASFWGSSHVYVSWNGATEVKHWRLEAARLESSLDEIDSLNFTQISTVLKEGFETSFTLPTVLQVDYYYLRAAALSSDGVVLGYTRIVEIKSQQIAWACAFKSGHSPNGTASSQAYSSSQLSESSESLTKVGKGPWIFLLLHAFLVTAAIGLIGWFLWHSRLRNMLRKGVRHCLCMSWARRGSSSLLPNVKNG